MERGSYSVTYRTNTALATQPLPKLICDFLLWYYYSPRHWLLTSCMPVLYICHFYKAFSSAIFPSFYKHHYSNEVKVYKFMACNVLQNVLRNCKITDQMYLSSPLTFRLIYLTTTNIQWKTEVNVHHLRQMYWVSNRQSIRRKTNTCQTCQAHSGNHTIADVGRTTTATATSVT